MFNVGLCSYTIDSTSLACIEHREPFEPPYSRLVELGALHQLQNISWFQLSRNMTGVAKK